MTHPALVLWPPVKRFPRAACEQATVCSLVALAIPGPWWRTTVAPRLSDERGDCIDA